MAAIIESDAQNVGRLHGRQQPDILKRPAFAGLSRRVKQPAAKAKGLAVAHGGKKQVTALLNTCQLHRYSLLYSSAVQKHAVFHARGLAVAHGNSAADQHQVNTAVFLERVGEVGVAADVIIIEHADISAVAGL